MNMYKNAADMPREELESLFNLMIQFDALRENQDTDMAVELVAKMQDIYYLNGDVDAETSFVSEDADAAEVEETEELAA